MGAGSKLIAWAENEPYCQRRLFGLGLGYRGRPCGGYALIFRMSLQGDGKCLNTSRVILEQPKSKDKNTLTATVRNPERGPAVSPEKSGVNTARFQPFQVRSRGTITTTA